MKCTNCGAELAPEDKFCGECGAPRPQLPLHFAEAEHRFAELRARYQSGELDDAAYDAELEKLVIEDDAGDYWMLGADSGEWYWYDGQQWVRRDPPLSEARVAAPRPAPTPVTAPPAAVAVRKARRLPRWALVVIPLVLILGAGGLFLVTPYGQLARCSIAIALEDPQNPDHYLRYLERAQIYRYDLNDLDSAIADYTKLIELRPNLRHLRAEVYEEQGNYEMALADYSTAIELTPKSAWLYVDRGWIYELLDRMDRALADYDRAIALDPDRCYYYLRRGDVHRELGNVTQARADYEKVLSFSDDDCRSWLRDRAQEALAELGATPVTQVRAVTPTPVPPTPTKVPTPTRIPTATPTKVRTPTPIPTPTEALVFEDGFTDNSGGWLEGEKEHVKRWIEDGEYNILVKTDYLVAWSTYKENRYSDFVFTAVARQVSDLPGQYGLVFRLKDDDNFYYFRISDDGYYRIVKQLEDEWIDIVEWTSSPAINQGQTENILAVVCVGDEISVYVNDQELATVSDDSFAEGRIGLTAGTFEEPGVHVAFDWVMVEPIE